MPAQFRRPAISVSLAALLLLSGAARASFHTFQIDELYSSPDGSVQFVELHESFNSPGEQFLAGHTLVSTQGGQTRTFTFPANLPSSATQNRFVLIATPAFAAAAGVTPDYVVPAPFLFPGGGTVDYAGVDQVTYPALPGDGHSSLDRSGVAAAATPTNFAGEVGVLLPPPPPPPPATVAAGVPALQPLAAAALIGLVAALGTWWIRRRA
jgi:hypothetical protein